MAVPAKYTVGQIVRWCPKNFNARVNDSGFQIDVKIVSAQLVFNRWVYVITPAAGSGTTKVNEDGLTPKVG